MTKTQREYELCRGIADSEDHGLKYWLAWEEGRAGATAPPDPQLHVAEHFLTDGCCESPPPLPERAWSLSKSIAQFVSDGFRFVSTEQFRQRLEICEPCEFRSGRTCQACGCYLDLKARMRKETCPKGFWKPEPDKKVQLPKRIKPQKHPPHVSFVKDREYRDFPGFHNLVPEGTAFMLCGGPSVHGHPIHLLQQPGIFLASVNNSPLGPARKSKSPGDVIRPHVWFTVDKPKHFHASLWLDPAVMKFSKLKWAKYPIRTFDGKHWVSDKQRVRDLPNIWFYQHSKECSIEEFLCLKYPTWWRQPHRSVMFVALRILFYMGIRRLYLLGVDFEQKPKGDAYSFADPMPASRARYNTTKFEGINDLLTKLRPHFEEYGFQVLHCTPGSKLTAFDYVPFEAAIADAVSRFPETIEPKGLYLK